MGRREARRAAVPPPGTGRGSRVAAAAVCVGLSAGALSLGSTAVQVATAPSSSSSLTVTGGTELAAAQRSGPSAPDSGPSAQDSEPSAQEVLPGGTSAAAVPAPEAVAVAAAPAPVALRVPSLDIDSPLVRLGVNDDGTLEVPADAGRAGWFDRGPAPGAVGPAVLAGHVDSRSGPGVFAHLVSLQVGAVVDVDREDGSTVSFRVTGVQQVAKDAFPSAEVYGPVAGSELRLITCGGAFDDATGHYVDNVVVFARET